MGGLGSGGWNATGRTTTGQALTLDVNNLNKRGVLTAGVVAKSEWTRGGEPYGNIQIHSKENEISLIYKTRIRDGDWQDVNEAVSIVWEPCRFGGQRPFFLCPQCGRRIIKLYGVSRFLCRTCNNLIYPSQRERWSDRALRKANRLRQKLGGNPGMASSIAPRPRYMHHRTYEQITDGIHESETTAMEFTFALVKRLTKRTPVIGDFWT